MWYCPHCSAENEDTDNICWKCKKDPLSPMAEPIIKVKERSKDEPISCPCCGSTQIVANKKGFSVTNALVGGVLLGGVGLLGGFVGSGNIKLTCLKCGYKWNI